MEINTFDSYGALEREVLALMKEHMCRLDPEPHAIMLTGGRTPLGLYEHIRRRPFAVDPALSVLISDEGYVSVESPESTYGRMSGMLREIGVGQARAMKVRTELPIEDAARRYDEELTAYLENGIITLGFLGLGADGHVASLFAPSDIAAGAGKFAIAVRRPDGSYRITVTRDLLLRVQRLVLVVTGKSKSGIIEKMQSAEEQTTAGQVLQGVPSAEIWYSRFDS